MKRTLTALFLTALAATPSMAADLSTPQGALQALEHAYLAQDIEAAVAAKNFQYEGRAMLEHLKSMPNPEPDLVQKAAHVLELAFRKQIQDQGFPQFADLRSRIVATKQLAPDLVEITEEFVFPDGYVSQEAVYAAKSGDHWGVVVLPSK